MATPSSDHPTTTTTTTSTLPPTKPPRPPTSQITPHLYLGSTHAGNSLKLLSEHSITAIISLEENRGPLMGRPDFKAHFPPSHRLFIACADSSTQDMLVHLGRVCGFIDRQLDAGVGGPEREEEEEGYVEFVSGIETLRREVERIGEGSWTRRGEPRVLVHCEKGYSRSAMVVIAYLMRRNRAPLEEGLKEVRGKRRVRPNGNFMAQLGVWESTGYDVWEEGGEVPKEKYEVYLRGRRGRLDELGLTGDEPVEFQSL